MEYPRLGGLNSRNLFFDGFGGWKSEIMVPASSGSDVIPSSCFGDSHLLILTLPSWGVGAARESYLVSLLHHHVGS